jgi:hypothetical protein
MVLHLWQPKIANLSVFVATVTPTSWVMSFSTSEPIAFFDAERYKVWHDAMRDEIQALCSNHTWFLVPFYPLMNVIGSRWVYKIKRRVDGSIKHYKACLVARGFTQ